MRNVKRTAGIVAIVLGLTSVWAMAQGPGSNPAAVNQSSFKGVVVNVSPLGLLVKGELTPPSPSANKTVGGSKGKADSRSVNFSVRGAKITRDGFRPAELKDIQKGETVTVTFAPATQGRAKFAAIQIDLAGEASAEKQSVLGKPGKVLFEDDFSRDKMPPKWRPGKGSWEIHDGVVTAAEKSEDSHAAYAHVDPRFPYKDIVAEFSFKFDGSTSCQFVMDDSNYKEAHAGHIIRASITPASVTLADSKFGSMKNEIFEKMKDPQTTAEQKKEIQASIKDKSATFKIALEADKWHQARVEVVGDEMLLSIDNRPVGYFQSEGVNHPTKNSINISVGGKSTQLDNVKVWEATAREDWSKNRSAVQAVLKK